MWEPSDGSLWSWDKYFKLLLARGRQDSLSCMSAKSTSRTHCNNDKSFDISTEPFQSVQTAAIKKKPVSSCWFLVGKGLVTETYLSVLQTCRLVVVVVVVRIYEHGGYARRRETQSRCAPLTSAKLRFWRRRRRKKENGRASLKAPWLCHYHPLLPAAPSFSHSFYVRAHLSIPCSLYPPPPNTHKNTLDAHTYSSLPPFKGHSKTRISFCAFWYKMYTESTDYSLWRYDIFGDDDIFTFYIIW